MHECSCGAGDHLSVLYPLPPRGPLVLNSGHQPWCRYFYLLSHLPCPGPFLYAIVLWKKPPCPENLVPFLGIFHYIPLVCLTSSSLPLPADTVRGVQFVRFCFLAWAAMGCCAQAFGWHFQCCLSVRAQELLFVACQYYVKNNTVVVVLLLFHSLAEISLFFSLPLSSLAFFETRSQQAAHTGLKLTVLLPHGFPSAGLVHLYREPFTPGARSPSVVEKSI